MKKVSIKPLPDLIVDDFVASNDLFTLFDSVPANVIFLDNFVSNIVSFKDIFERLNMRENIFFSCKANKSNALLQMAAEQQCGIEVSSYYELMDALKYTNKIIASGPAKEKYYLDCAVENNILISVDDIEELKSIKKLNKRARVILRISDLLGIISRFGINISQIDESIKIIKESKMQLVGFSFHINNYNLEDRVNAVLQVLEIIKQKKLNVQYIDIGGGLPINYCTKEEFYDFLKENHEKMYFKNKMINEFYPYYSELASYKALEYILRKLKSKLGKIEIIIEPGRSLLNNCGISIYEVKYLKHLSNGDALIISNGNINCLSEQWFNSDYLIEPILYKKRSNDVSKEDIEASVAGNLCLEQDIITWRKIRFENTPEEGDYLIYYNTAGYQMDSNESNFHKLPLVEKYIVKRSGKKYEVRKDYLYDSKKITDLIGETPMLKLNMKNNEWNVYLKLEKFNPGGSMKDRMAYNMIEVAEKEGKLRPGGTIIESSSGNTAIGLAIAAAIKGYKFIAVVDHHASKEKIDTIKAYGGEIIVVGKGYKDNEVAVIEREKMAAKMAKDIPNSFFPNQADNFNNRSAYIDTLANELVNELEKIDAFYGAIGTGGSICGTSMGLKKRKQKTVINAIEPDGSIIFGGLGKPYFQSGTGNPKNAPIPKIIDYSLIDNNFYATDKEAFNTCRFFAKKYGLLIGGSAGGVLFKGLEDINKKSGGGNAVILLCDGGEKYLNNIYNDDWMMEKKLFDCKIEKSLREWIKEV